MASLPLVGSIDWKWLIIGILVDRFLLHFVMGLFARAKETVSPSVQAG